MRRMEWVLLTQLNPTSRGWVYFEQHIPKDSWSGISDHFPVNVLCQHQSTDHWSREDASLPPLKETRPSPFQSHVQGQNCQVGTEGVREEEGCRFQVKEARQGYRDKFGIANRYMWRFLPNGFYLGNYLNYSITDRWYQKSVYTEPLTYVLDI